MSVPRLVVPRRFRIIAHRGASGYAPENTFAAFALAANLGAREIEFDLQFSKDRQIVVVHDEVLDRYGFPGCSVAQMTLAELKQLDMGKWFGDRKFDGEKLLTLDELLATFGDRFTYHAEIKVMAKGLAHRAVETFQTYGLLQHTIFTSFFFDVLQEVAELAPAHRLGWLVRRGGFTKTNLERAAAARLFQFCPRADETDRVLVAAAKKYVPEIRVHGVRNMANLEQAFHAGCDGATINWPDWLQHA